MTTKRWIGNALPSTQVWSFTITTNDPATAYGVKINGKTISIVGASGGASSTATALAAALAASTIAEFQEVSWTANAAAVVGTGKTVGKPFTAAATVSGGTGAVGSVGDVIACTGPTFVDNAANWDTGLLPANGDDVYVENGSIDILYNVQALASVALSSFNVAANFTGNIGLPQNTGKYQEYRVTFLNLQATNINIGYGPGSGSPRIRISSMNSYPTTITVSNTAASSEQGLPAFCWDGEPGPGSSMQVLRGSVGVGGLANNAAAVDLLEVGYVTNVQGDAQVLIGPKGGATSYVIAGGNTVQQNGGMGNVVMTNGTLTAYGTGNCTQFIINGGTFFWNSTGTLGAATNYISGKGTLDLSQDMQPKTFFTGGVIYATKGATINDPSNVFTTVSGYITITPQGCSMADLNLNFGYGRSVRM